MTQIPDRKWWPEHMLDESMPPGKTDPSEWLAFEGPRILFGRLTSEAGDPGEVVAVGDEVTLAYADDLGIRPVTFHADGTFTVEGGEPEGWNRIWDEDEHEDVGDDLATHARNLREWENLPYTQELRFLKWGEAKFLVGIDDGRPVLHMRDIDPAEGL